MSVTDVKACVRVVNVYWFQYIFSYDFFRLPSYFYLYIYIRATWNDDGKNVEINVYVTFYCVPRKFSLRVFYSYLYLIISNVLWDRIPLLLCPYTLFFKNLYYSITYSHIFFTWNDACRVFYIFEMKRRFSHATLYPIQLRYTFLVLINPRNAIPL